MERMRRCKWWQKQVAAEAGGSRSRWQQKQMTAETGGSKSSS
ncbi:hypothetical protein [Methanimicrococcus hacksteinii]|nr:hypothetical protein [Methanimicrococcus sp. At1]